MPMRVHVMAKGSEGSEGEHKSRSALRGRLRGGASRSRPGGLVYWLWTCKVHWQRERKVIRVMAITTLNSLSPNINDRALIRLPPRGCVPEPQWTRPHHPSVTSWLSSRSSYVLLARTKRTLDTFTLLGLDRQLDTRPYSRSEAFSRF